MSKSVNNLAMSCKEKGEIILFLFVVTIYFYTFQLCNSVRLGQRQGGFSIHQSHEPTATSWERIQQDNDVQQGNRNSGEQVIHLRKSDRRGLQGLRLESTAFLREPLTDISVPKLDETDSNFALSSLSLTVGNVSTIQRSWPSHSEDEYQGDFTGKNCSRDHNAGELDNIEHYLFI